jgi:hypothetical protein
VTISTIKTKYRALANSPKEVVWLQLLLKELQYLEDTPTRLQCDNQYAIKLVQNPVFHACMKHIEIYHHYVHEQVDSGQLDVLYVAITKQEVEILIKLI